MKIDFNKCNGLAPVIIQDYISNKVLMLGFMNEEAWKKTSKDNIVTFYSRSKKRLWTKGETSGNYLTVKEILVDCDSDSVLIKVIPRGPVCHKGSFSCFSDNSIKGTIYNLEETIDNRITENRKGSYTNKLYKKGLDKILQKTGEEAVELIIASKGKSIKNIKDEAADLLYHLLVLLRKKTIKFEDLEAVLAERAKG
jgi:phosphoribosyl-AMP cyclohydrolase / phosphoribosyl-ATP pyrophosphohydrolase